MLTRVAAVPVAAAVVLVTAPGIVVRTIAPATPGSGPIIELQPKNPKNAPTPPTPASLKIHVETGPDLHLRVLAAGRAPVETSLVDESGRHRATVYRAPAAQCGGAKTYDTTVGTDIWCLDVNGLGSGHELTGTLTGKKTELALALTRREALAGPPLAILLLGLLAPLLVALYLWWLRRRVGNAVVEQRLRAATGVSGLEDWVHAPAQRKLSPGDLAALIDTIVNGADSVRTARAELGHALALSGLPRSIPYVQDAWDEAEKRDVVPDDVLNGHELRDPPAAKEMSATLPALVRGFANLEHARGLLPHVPPAHHVDVETAVNEAQSRLDELASPDDVAAFSDAADAADDAARAATGEDGAETPGVAGSEARLLDVAFTGRTISLAPDFGAVRRRLAGHHLSAQRAFTDTAVGVVATILAMAVTLAFAFATVLQAAYLSKPDFAGGWDLFTLFSAAFVSGAAATVISLADYWRPKPSDS